MVGVCPFFIVGGIRVCRFMGSKVRSILQAPRQSSPPKSSASSQFGLLIVSHSRSVPNMEPEKISKLVIDYVNDVFTGLKSKNVMKCETGHGGKAWLYVNMRGNG
jgi:hypothetical protein